MEDPPTRRGRSYESGTAIESVTVTKMATTAARRAVLDPPFGNLTRSFEAALALVLMMVDSLRSVVINGLQRQIGLTKECLEPKAKASSYTSNTERGAWAATGGTPLFRDMVATPIEISSLEVRDDTGIRSEPVLSYAFIVASPLSIEKAFITITQTRDI
ncbi:uncharacterized protein THITE_2128562 [Thermothielavioides terrestris NRRL 8126]|uniref:Uncharacterized protein n=1 Tax=Thermothielavioides terrestris (strain ATCC 38088 / NRRL 8126) TaxID=578455 RepID=G2R107_THETT|nr:uncharacterized protein THITE_2128562 [Thermothielavioides terrestris NRRL 8126]AEO66504.1 hypothetical protein THITE_2128562 [Thermothielavioides terrestris NRRL 8126]